jgi:hypothetical protein
VDATQQIYPPAVDDADLMKAKFTTCFIQYTKCHNLYNKAAKMEVDETTELGMLHCIHVPFSSHTEICVNQFLEFTRKEFPSATIPPKLHMFIDHAITINFIRSGSLG